MKKNWALGLEPHWARVQQDHCWGVLPVLHLQQHMGKGLIEIDPGELTLLPVLGFLFANHSSVVANLGLQLTRL